MKGVYTAAYAVQVSNAMQAYPNPPNASSGELNLETLLEKLRNEPAVLKAEKELDNNKFVLAAEFGTLNKSKLKSLQ